MFDICHNEAKTTSPLLNQTPQIASLHQTVDWVCFFLLPMIPVNVSSTCFAGIINLRPEMFRVIMSAFEIWALLITS